jgi:hypothetical protein
MKRGSNAGCVVIACALVSSSTAAAPPSASSDSSSSLSSSAKARVALFIVPGEGAVALRARLRDRLASSSTQQLLDDDTLRLRLRGPAGVALDIATVRATVAAADDAFRTLDHERSVALLESAIEALEADRDFSVEKQELLEQARLTCAQRLVGLAGPDETGKSETKNGQRARVHLAHVLRSNPTFALDAKRYPPKMRALLALATDDVKQAGMGSLLVRSTEPGAVVRVDGRHIGSTPLALHEGLAAGRFRLWLEAGALRSFTRVVDVVAGAEVPVEVDVAFEAALRPVDLGVRPSRPFASTDWQRAAGFLDVDVIDVVGVEHTAVAGTASTPTTSTSTSTTSTSSSTLAVWAAVVDGHTGSVLRGVRVPVASVTADGDHAVEQTGDHAVDERVVALFQGGAGDDGFVGPVDVFARAAPSPTTRSAAAVVEGDGFPWLGVGIGVGVGVAVAATVGVALQATKTTTETFSVTVKEPGR